MNSAREFYVERNRAIAQAYAEGIAVAIIAKQYGIAPITAAMIARAHGSRMPKWRRGYARTIGARSPDRDRIIGEQYLSGRSLEDVGQEHGVTRERIRQILKRDGIEERHQGFNQPRRVVARIALQARQEANAARKLRIDTERAKVRELYDAGQSYFDIAQALGHSIAWVQNIVWVTGGPSRSRSARKPKRQLSDLEKSEIARRYGAGENIGVIAEEYDICLAYVSTVAHNLGVYRPNYSARVSRTASETPDGGQAPQPSAIGGHNSDQATP